MPAADPVMEERRDLRDAARASGFGLKRPLYSYMTAAEKRQSRQDHAAMLCGLYCRLGEEPELAGEWLATLERNAHLSPINGLIAAAYAPGQVVAAIDRRYCAVTWATFGMRVREGEHARFRFTGRGFVPVAAFTERQVVGGLDGATFDPSLDEAVSAVLRPDVCAAYREAVSASQKASAAVREVAEAFCGEGASGLAG